MKDKDFQDLLKSIEQARKNNKRRENQMGFFKSVGGFFGSVWSGVLKPVVTEVVKEVGPVVRDVAKEMAKEEVRKLARKNDLNLDD